MEIFLQRKYTSFFLKKFNEAMHRHPTTQFVCAYWVFRVIRTLVSFSPGRPEILYWQCPQGTKV